MYTRHTPLALGICFGALLVSAFPGAASVVVFTCTGTIEPSSAIDHTAFDSSVGADTPFTATFAVDSTATDLTSFDPNFWDYVDHDPLNEAYVQFGNYALVPDLTSGAVNSLAGANNSGTLDSLTWESYNSAGSGLSAAFVQARMQDSTGTALTAKGLPPAGPGLNDFNRWDSGILFFAAESAIAGRRVGWYGHLTSISTHVQESPIPEPGSLALLSAGLPTALLAMRKRRSGC